MVKFGNTWHGKNLAKILGNINGLFDSILQQGRAEGIQDRDLVRIHIRHPDVIRHGDIKVSLRPFKEITPEVITSTIEQFLQSDDSLAFDEKFEIALGSIQMPAGGTILPISSTTGVNNSLALKKSIVHITNSDLLCLARSLVVCRAYKQFKDNVFTRDHYRYICRSNKAKQRILAEELQTSAGIPLNKVCYVQDIAKFEYVLDAQIIVFSAAHDNEIIYAGQMERDTKYFVYLVENEGIYILLFLQNILFCVKLISKNYLQFYLVFIHL